MRLPGVFREASFENCIVGNGNREAFERAKEFVEKARAKETPKGLVLIGPPGVGKSYLCAAIVNELRPLFVVRTEWGGELADYYRWWSVPELLDAIRASYDGESLRNPYQEAREISVLVLDDLGKERVTDWVLERLFALVNYRWEEQKPVLVTSNLSLKELARKYDRWFVSRLIGMGHVVQVRGEDRRIVKGGE